MLNVDLYRYECYINEQISAQFFYQTKRSSIIELLNDLKQNKAIEITQYNFINNKLLSALDNFYNNQNSSSYIRLLKVFAYNSVVSHDFIDYSFIKCFYKAGFNKNYQDKACVMIVLFIVDYLRELNKHSAIN